MLNRIQEYRKKQESDAERELAQGFNAAANAVNSPVLKYLNKKNAA